MPRRHVRWFALAMLLWAVPWSAWAQDLEPRRWSHLPMDLNIVGAGIGAVDGEIFLDPVLRIEDGSFDLYVAGVSYIRTFEWLKHSSRFDANLPWGNGRWEGLIDGVPDSVRRDGPMDPWVRLSMHLWGAPPLKGREFAEYRAQHPVSTTVGASLSLTLPWGEYIDGKLINLGNNRYVLRPQLGILHTRGPWQLELTGTVSFYGDNDAFFLGSKLEQDPLVWLQAHVIRSFGKGRWASLSGGYTFAGETTVNGVAKDNADRSQYLSLAYGFQLTPRQSMKITWINAQTNVLIGKDTDTLSVGWSINWSD